MGVNALEIGTFRNQIMLEQEKLNHKKICLVLETNIYSANSHCDTCKKTCDRNEKQNKYQLYLIKYN